MGVSAQKLITVVVLAAVHTIALIYALLVWKPNLTRPIVFLAVSATIFTCLCVDLARDELQNFAYYPLTNLIFLTSFTISCIASKTHLIKNYWPFVQLTAALYYILHEQFTARQILFYALENGQGLNPMLVMGLVLPSFVLLHIGSGTLLRNLMETDQGNRFMENNAMEITEQDEDFISLTNTQKIEKVLENQEEAENELLLLIQRHRELPQIIKAGTILVPPVLELVSFIWQSLFSSQTHTHGHTHMHRHFSSKSAYFEDITNLSNLSTVLFVVRLMCSGVLFHCLFRLWNQCLTDITEDKMKHRYWLSFIGLCIGIGRLLAQRF